MSWRLCQKAKIQRCPRAYSASMGSAPSVSIRMDLPRRRIKAAPIGGTSVNVSRCRNAFIRFGASLGISSISQPSQRYILELDRVEPLI